MHNSRQSELTRQKLLICTDATTFPIRVLSRQSKRRYDQDMSIEFSIWLSAFVVGGLSATTLAIRWIRITRRWRSHNRAVNAAIDKYIGPRRPREVPVGRHRRCKYSRHRLRRDHGKPGTQWPVPYDRLCPPLPRLPQPARPSLSRTGLYASSLYASSLSR